MFSFNKELKLDKDNVMLEIEFFIKSTMGQKKIKANKHFIQTFGVFFFIESLNMHQF